MYISGDVYAFRATGIAAAGSEKVQIMAWVLMPFLEKIPGNKNGLHCAARFYFILMQSHFPYPGTIVRYRWHWRSHHSKRQ